MEDYQARATGSWGIILHLLYLSCQMSIWLLSVAEYACYWVETNGWSSKDRFSYDPTKVPNDVIVIMAI